MIEFTTITVICILLLLYFRPGKTPPLDNPLVIERAGQYHVTLAAQLNLAQPLIEAIAGKLQADNTAKSNDIPQYFEVRDKHAKAHGADYYLLAITPRNGMLYFQAISPQLQNQGSNLGTIRAFSESVLARFPPAGAHNSASTDRILKAVQEVAQMRAIMIKSLPE